MHICEDKKEKQSAPILKWYLEKIDVNCNRPVLVVLVWSEKKPYSATGMEKNFHLFDKSWI